MECPWATGDYHVIVLVEVLWEVIAIIVDQRLVEYIEFHEVLTGFRALIGTGVVTLKAKPLQYILGLHQEVLYDIFVDLQKSYDALDQERALSILEGYRLGTQVFQLRTRYWYCSTMVTRSSRY